jgi:hypothetical protein
MQVRVRYAHPGGLLLAGRRDERLGALVVEHGEPAAYCMSGIRRPVVLTTPWARARARRAPGRSAPAVPPPPPASGG